MTRRYTNNFIQASAVQEGTQFNGTAGNGKFDIVSTALLTGLFIKNDNAVDWDVELLIPDPEDPANPILYPWFSVTGAENFSRTEQVYLPAGSSICVSADSGSANCVGQIVYQNINFTAIWN